MMLRTSPLQGDGRLSMSSWSPLADGADGPVFLAFSFVDAGKKWGVHPPVDCANSSRTRAHGMRRPISRGCFMPAARRTFTKGTEEPCSQRSKLYHIFTARSERKHGWAIPSSSNTWPVAVRTRDLGRRWQVWTARDMSRASCTTKDVMTLVERLLLVFVLCW